MDIIYVNKYKYDMLSNNSFKRSGFNIKYSYLIFIRNNMDDFRLNKEIFNKEIIEKYNMDFKNIIQFCIILPFYLPVKDNTILSFVNDGSVLSFEFTKKNKDNSYIYNFSEKSEYKNETYISKVEMTFSQIEMFEKEERVIDNCFNILLDKLNEILLAYKIQKKDLKIYKVREEMLSPIVLYRVIEVKKWKEQSGILLLHIIMQYNEKMLNDDELNELVRHICLINTNNNPFLNVPDYLISAKRYMNNGFYEDSVININIAVESFLRTIYKYFLKLENNDINENDINEKLENIPFLRIVKTEMSIRLGGQWNVDKENEPIGKWYKYVYELRNKVIHGTKKLNYNELDNAWNYANGFIIYVKNLIKLKKNKYPELYSYLFE